MKRSPSPPSSGSFNKGRPLLAVALPILWFLTERIIIFGCAGSILAPNAVGKKWGAWKTMHHNRYPSSRSTPSRSGVCFQALPIRINTGNSGRILERALIQPSETPRKRANAQWMVSRKGSFSRKMDDDDEEDDDEEEEDEMPAEVDVAQFRPPTASFGYNRGRSSPLHRTALGRSAKSAARVFLCSTCASEFVQWRGQCPTCQEWNTLQEHVVTRKPTILGSSSSSSFMGGPRGSTSSFARPASWLDGAANLPSWAQQLQGPVRMTDLYENSETSRSAHESLDPSDPRQPHHRRIVVPGDAEFNTVLGGGIMKGALVLLGGDPGVGKSTLLLQTAAAVASLCPPTAQIGRGLPTPTALSSSPSFPQQQVLPGPVWYVSGEETPEQIATRAQRLGLSSTELFLYSETHVDTICERIAQLLEQQQPPPPPSASSWGLSATTESESRSTSSSDQLDTVTALFRPKPPSLLVIDSIQTMVCDAAGPSAAGGVTQVRECVALLLRLAKSTQLPILLVGHVTKQGDVAGPRTVEHMVDCVLYLEGYEAGRGGDAGSGGVRMLRASKNRFGSSQEAGVYEMTAGRLWPVSDASSLFLAHRNQVDDMEGCAIAIALEGMRAMTVEIQALVTPASGNSGYGRRTVDGISSSRLLLLLGLLQKRLGFFMARQDVYINVVGRMRLDRAGGGDAHHSNAADLAVAIALVSSLTGIAVRADTAFVGEVGLLGELRPVQVMEKRLQEARRMGFSRVVTPKASVNRGTKNKPLSSMSKKNVSRVVVSTLHGIEWVQCDNVQDAINQGLVQPVPSKRKKRTSKGAKSPESVEELGLDEIMDDGEDDDETSPFQ